jgi:hypothetical protein
MDYSRVLEILHKLKDRSASRTEINDIINLSMKISKAYLLRNFHKISRLYKYFHTCQEEVALDAIASLFCLDKDGKDYNIIHSFNSWYPPVENEQQAFYFLNKIIASGIEQYISEMLRESDPVFSKIYNSINYIIRKRGYSRIDFAGCKYIVKKETDKFSSDFIDFETFENIPVSCFLDKTYIDDIFDHIESLKIFAPAIPVNHLVARLKRVYMDYSPAESTGLIEQQMIINEAINIAMSDTGAVLKEKYFLKGKLTEEETDYFLLALNDMVYDLRDGGLNPGIQKYLLKYNPALQDNLNYDVYHNILEYLFKLLKKRIVENLDKIKEF